MNNSSNKIQFDNSNSAEQYWIEQINLKVKSGLSRATYCKKHNMSYHQFGYWEQKLTRISMPAELLPVELSIPQGSSVQSVRTLCTLILKNETELKVHDVAVIPALLSVLN